MAASIRRTVLLSLRESSAYLLTLVREETAYQEGHMSGRRRGRSSSLQRKHSEQKWIIISRVAWKLQKLSSPHVLIPKQQQTFMKNNRRRHADDVTLQTARKSGEEMLNLVDMKHGEHGGIITTLSLEARCSFFSRVKFL